MCVMVLPTVNTGKMKANVVCITLHKLVHASFRDCFRFGFENEKNIS